MERPVDRRVVMRTFAGKAGALAALFGALLVAVLASAGYSFVSTIRRADEALSTYSEELILAWSLQEAQERKLASGRGFLLAHDASEQRAFEVADADLRAALVKLRARVASAEGIAMLDATGRAVVVHDHALREVMDLPVGAGDIARRWKTDVMAKATAAREKMDAFIHHKQILQGEARTRAHVAQRRAAWIMGATALAAALLGVTGGGHFYRAARSSYEVETRGRESAEKERHFFKALLDQLPIGIVAAEPSGRILHVSAFAHAMLTADGHSLTTAHALHDGAALLDQTDGTLRRPDDLPLSRALRGELVEQEELRSDSGRVFSVTAGPIRDEHGGIVAAVVGLVDVSERKRAERERELFIGALGHDLRSPLSAISLAAGTLTRHADLPEPALKAAARIVSSAGRMGRLIGELLDFARSQHGAIPIHPEPCRLSEVAGEVVGEIKVSHPDREIRVDPKGGCEGRWDRGRIAQVFQNLVGNAVEHGVPGAPITVRTGCDGDTVWATVTNHGGPIPPEERHRLFNPFRTGASSKGLGLGLYITRAIVEAHGGTIKVESDGGATTFRIELPPTPAASKR